jgi:rubrerythrin
MKLINFGAALKFATDSEAHVIEVYEEAGQKLVDPEVKGLLLSFAALSKKRKALLERLYKENTYSDMDTGIFEPIAGLNDTDYSTHAKPSYEGGLPDILKWAIEIEDAMERFYHDLAAQLKSRRSGLAREFVKAAQEISDGKLRLKPFL